MQNSERKTQSGIVLPPGVDYQEPIPPTSPDDIPVIPGLGITSGFALEDRLHLQPVISGESKSPYHKVRGTGEKRFTSREDIEAELESERPRDKRTQLVESFLGDIVARDEVRTAADDLTEVRPVLVGIRRAIVNIRLGMTEAALKRQAEDELVVTSAAEKINKGKSYKKPDDPLRPTTVRQRQVVEGLQTAKERRVRRFSDYMYFGHSYGEDVHTPDYINRRAGRNATTDRESGFAGKTQRRAATRMRRFKALQTHHERVVESEKNRTVSLAKREVRLRKKLELLNSAAQKAETRTTQ